MNTLAQVPDLVNSAGTRLLEGGVLGAVVLLLILRDLYLENRRDARESHREAARSAEVDKLVNAVNAREEVRDKKTDRLVESIGELVQSNLMETLSRPNLQERTKTEAEFLQRKYRERARG